MNLPIAILKPREQYLANSSSMGYWAFKAIDDLVPYANLDEHTGEGRITRQLLEQLLATAFVWGKED